MSTPYETLTTLNPNSIEHSIASAVAEYACELVKSDSARALSILRLAARLRDNAHEIAAGGQAEAEMEALISAASLTEGDEYAALYWVLHAVIDDIVSDEDANDSRLEP
jgi:hypothetical protein